MYKKQHTVKEFSFGVDPVSSISYPETIRARSYEEAVKQFTATCTNPILQVCKEDIKKDEKGFYKTNYNHTEYESPYELVDNPRIKVIERDLTEGTKKHYLPLKACYEVDYTKFRKVSGLLGASEYSEKTAIVKSESGISLQNKSEILKKRDELALLKKKYEMESQKLGEAIRKLEEEVRSKRKLLHGMEVYAGIGCDTFELQDGARAEREEKLHIHQEVCFIDEELSIWKECWKISGGADYNNLEDFEGFIKVHFKEYLPHPLSIMAWRIRRRKKEYDNFWEDLTKNKYNFITVIIFRDGERLVEFIPEISVGEEFFPKTEDIEKVIADAKQYGRDKKESLHNFYEKHIFALLFLQGLIDNTDIFPERFKGENLCSIQSEKVVYIRDAEKEYWIQDGRPSWYDFIKKNHESIDVGCRIIFVGEPRCHYWGNELEERTGIRTIYSGPKSNTIYTVTEKRNRIYSGEQFKFTYLPKEDVWDEEGYHERKRKVGFWFYPSEVINIDAITVEEIDYYLKNRIYRRHYLEMMPALFLARQILEKEALEERNFVAFLRSRLSFEVSDEAFEKAIQDYKLRKYNGKTERKWKRSLIEDGTTALEQIEKILKRSKC